MTTTKSNSSLGLLLHFSSPMFLLVCFIFFALPKPSYASMLTKYHIHIINDLPRDQGPNTLYVHCKSGDDDKGLQELRYGQEFVWGTRVNAFRTTLFFCSLRWEQVKERYIDAFKAKRDEGRCKRMKACLWKVRASGAFFSNDNVTWRNEYPWQLPVK